MSLHLQAFRRMPIFNFTGFPEGPLQQLIGSMKLKMRPDGLGRIRASEGEHLLPNHLTWTQNLVALGNIGLELLEQIATTSVTQNNGYLFLHNSGGQQCKISIAWAKSRCQQCCVSSRNSRGGIHSLSLSISLGCWHCFLCHTSQQPLPLWSCNQPPSSVGQISLCLSLIGKFVTGSRVHSDHSG